MAVIGLPLRTILRDECLPPPLIEPLQNMTPSLDTLRLLFFIPLPLSGFRLGAPWLEFNLSTYPIEFHSFLLFSTSESTRFPFKVGSKDCRHQENDPRPKEQTQDPERRSSIPRILAGPELVSPRYKRDLKPASSSALFPRSSYQNHHSILQVFLHLCNPNPFQNVSLRSCPERCCR